MPGRPRSCSRARENVLIAVAVPTALREQLHACAQATGMSVSQVIRRGIRAALLVLESSRRPRQAATRRGPAATEAHVRGCHGT